ncbi:CBS domain-containing protein [Desulfohalotomaculum tongense]|uniref:CBS domain-containing protein n=1 Tax=Desulforadius tongensis TaxID=1216062 RepID=UPI00195A175B|nr:CBS domain-containing protein [Desulforadius tongensis]MBM7856148.1 CBS domain-containing protein [Desulforadius tongensis]
MGERLVRDLMVPIDEYPTINVNATMCEAIKILKRNFKKEANNVISGHKTLIVHDGENKTVGIVTLRSLLKAVAIEENKKNKIANLASALSFSKNKKDILSIRVKDIMRSRDIAHVYENQPLTRAIQLMVSKKVNSVLVIENPEVSELTYGEYPLENNRAVGIIRSMDVFEVIGDFLNIDYKIVTFPHFSGYTIANKT